MLELSGVNAFYGKSQVLTEVGLRVGEAEVVALLGRNGAGKSSTLKSVMGLMTTTGTITLDGTSLAGRTPFQIARRGIAYVPEHRGIFSNLTVEQNLVIAVRKGGRWTIDDVYDRFPHLARRRRNRGDRLSGGEQQMLAIARAMLGAPRIVLLDEPAEGLAPVIVEQVRDIIRELRREGVAALLVEQQIELCLQLADRVYVLESGQMVFNGTTAEFRAADDIRSRHLALRDVGQPD
jgi:branched-chain amino acid transport system ATP-binding protein